MSNTVDAAFWARRDRVFCCPQHGLDIVRRDDLDGNISITDHLSLIIQRRHAHENFFPFPIDGFIKINRQHTPAEILFLDILLATIAGFKAELV